MWTLDAVQRAYGRLPCNGWRESRGGSIDMTWWWLGLLVGAAGYTDCISAEDPPSNECPDGEASVMLDLWGMWSTTSALSFSGLLWPGVAAPYRILFGGGDFNRFSWVFFSFFCGGVCFFLFFFGLFKILCGLQVFIFINPSARAGYDTMDLALNNLQRLICHKTNKPN